METDLKKVITAFENCTAPIKCRDCPWEECESEHEKVELPKDLALVALASLKEKADTRLVPRKPYHTKVAYKSDGEITYWITDQCPECEERGQLGIWDTLLDRHVKYCRRCGQAIDWSEYEGHDQIDWEEYMSHVGERAKRMGANRNERTNSL